MNKPICYDCVFRADLPGSCHSKCEHPSVKGKENPIGEALAMLGGDRSLPVGLMLELSAKTLEIRGHPHGIAHGWFNWPYNFDPVWLENCLGFKKKENPST